MQRLGARDCIEHQHIYAFIFVYCATAPYSADKL